MKLKSRGKREKRKDVQLRTLSMPGLSRMACSRLWILSWYSSITSKMRSTTTKKIDNETWGIDEERSLDENLGLEDSEPRVRHLQTSLELNRVA